jgi:hypothetical protein
VLGLSFGAYSQQFGFNSQAYRRVHHHIQLAGGAEVIRKPFEYDPELIEKARRIVEHGLDRPPANRPPIINVKFQPQYAARRARTL